MSRSARAVPAAQGHALHTLTAMIEAHGPTPCAGQLAWISEDESAQTRAVLACRGCYALEECRAYGLAFRHESGVFGALTEAQRHSVE